MKKQERFSIRKRKIGAVSILLGAVFLLNNPAVSADTSSEENLLISEQTQTAEQTSPDEASSSEVGQESATSTTVEADSTHTAESTPSHEEKQEAPITEATSETKEETPSSQAPATATPHNIDSNTLITVPKTWEAGYTGEGMVVAVIDTGLDIYHDVLQLSDVSKAKYQSEEALEAAKAAAGISYGQWFNDKVIFGYNYVDANTILKEEDKNSHGMHVTGIAAGNPTNEASGELIKGVAPEAQVMFLRVFSDVNKTTGPYLYVQAIDDAVKLGADSINLSLGAANGSQIHVDETVLAAIDRARKAGVSVVIAAGNDGAFGSGHTNPRADNPDYGLVGDPSVARDAISVASYNNSSVSTPVVEILELGANDDLNNGRVAFSKPELGDESFEVGTVYSYTYLNLGKEEDYAQADVAGKVALIKRGDITFSEKIARAAAHGAIGAIIFNNRPNESNVSMSLDESAISIPSIFIDNRFGEILAANHYLLQFNNEVEKLPNPNANQLSDFTSWGLSADGQLKPDLAAPGGAIYSAINDGEYASMSGTSMASPHVAGAAVLVKQYLLQAYPEKTPSQIENLVKLLLMSTAKPHTNAITKAITSPRQQGAGLIDTAAAISTGLYLTGSDGYGSLTLGNVNDQFNLTITIHNENDTDRTLTYVTHLNTDEVADGHFTLRPRALEEIAGSPITVKAKSSQTITIAVDASKYKDELTSLMPNGYYLEGFVRFLDAVDKGEIVSIPYVGFRGAFQDIPVLETDVYTLIADQQGGFYFTPDSDLTLPQSEGYTALVTNSNDVVYSNNSHSATVLKTLGTFKDENGHFKLILGSDGQPHLAISPNKDENQDSLVFKGVFLRNYENLVANVYRSDDTNLETPLWTSQPADGHKNFYGGDPDREKASTVFATQWEGQDANGQALPDGHYWYILSYQSIVPGSNPQYMAFEVVIDREKETITTASFDRATATFKARPVITNGPATVYREQVFYLVTDDTGSATLTSFDPETKLTTLSDNKVYVAQNTDGSFTLPLDKADLDAFYYVVEDFAGNRSHTKLSTLVDIGNDRGLIEVKVVDAQTGEASPIHFSYAVYDQTGRQVTDLPRHDGNSRLLKLPFGQYTFKLFVYDKENGVLEGSDTVTLELTEAVSRKEVSFAFRTLTKADLLVDIDKALPAGTTVRLQLADGTEITLPAATYSPTDYSRSVPIGQHSLLIQLPEHYAFLEELTVIIKEKEQNIKKLTLIDQTALASHLQASQGITDTATYYNASHAEQTAFQEALRQAAALMGQKVSQEEIDRLTHALETARAALSGKETDTSRLRTAVQQSDEIKESALFYNADTPLQTAYETALRSARHLLETTPLTQLEVDTAFNNLQATQAALNGKETDTLALQTLLTQAREVVSNQPLFTYASKENQAAYREAIALAQAGLQLQAVRQEQINALLALLQQAEAALDGKEPIRVTPPIETVAQPLGHHTNRQPTPSPERKGDTSARKEATVRQAATQESQPALPQTGQQPALLTLLALLPLSIYHSWKKKEKE